MKKGLKLIKVEIDSDGKMKCFTISKSGEVASMTLTRTQRHLFRRYTDHDFIDQIESEFGPNMLDDTFVITMNGEIVFSLEED